jgi:hypothetical protein
MRMSSSYFFATSFASIDSRIGCIDPWIINLIKSLVVVFAQKLIVFIDGHSKSRFLCARPATAIRRMTYTGRFDRMGFRLGALGYSFHRRFSRSTA